MYVLFDNLPCLNPQTEKIEQDRIKKYDSRLFWEKANGFYCPIGEPYGFGYVLMLKKQLDQLDLYSNQHTLEMGDGSRNIIIYNLTVISTVCLTPSHNNLPTRNIDNQKPITNDLELDSKASYLVTFVDPRYFLFGKPLNKAYNTLNKKLNPIDTTVTGDPTDYLQPPLTWDEIIEQLWNSLEIGPYPKLHPFQTYPVTLPLDIPLLTNRDLTHYPENYFFYGDDTWITLNMLLERLGCAIVYNPLVQKNNFDIINLGEANLARYGDFNFDRLENFYKPYEILDRNIAYYWNKDTPARIPKEVNIVFNQHNIYYGTENIETDDWTIQPKTTVIPITADIVIPYIGRLVPKKQDITQLNKVPEVSYTNNEKIIYDDLIARIHNNETVLNRNALITRAQEIAIRYYRSLIWGAKPFYKQYSGACSFIPGPQIKLVNWINTTDGLKTEIISGHDFKNIYNEICPIKHSKSSSIENLTRPDFSRNTYPLYFHQNQLIFATNKTADANGVYEGFIYNLDNDFFTTLIKTPIYFYKIPKDFKKYKYGQIVTGKVNGSYLNINTRERRSLFIVLDCCEDENTPGMDMIKIIGYTVDINLFIGVTSKGATVFVKNLICDKIPSIGASVIGQLTNSVLSLQGLTLQQYILLICPCPCPEKEKQSTIFDTFLTTDTPSNSRYTLISTRYRNTDITPTNFNTFITYSNTVITNANTQITNTTLPTINPLVTPVTRPQFNENYTRIPITRPQLTQLTTTNPVTTPENVPVTPQRIPVPATCCGHTFPNTTGGAAGSIPGTESGGGGAGGPTGGISAAESGGAGGAIPTLNNTGGAAAAVRPLIIDVPSNGGAGGPIPPFVPFGQQSEIPPCSYDKPVTGTITGGGGNFVPDKGTYIYPNQDVQITITPKKDVYLYELEDIDTTLKDGTIFGNNLTGTILDNKIYLTSTLIESSIQITYVTIENKTYELILQINTNNTVTGTYNNQVFTAGTLIQNTVNTSSNVFTTILNTQTMTLTPKAPDSLIQQAVTIEYVPYIPKPTYIKDINTGLISTNLSNVPLASGTTVYVYYPATLPSTPVTINIENTPVTTNPPKLELYLADILFTIQKPVIGVNTFSIEINNTPVSIVWPIYASTDIKYVMDEELDYDDPETVFNYLDKLPISAFYPGIITYEDFKKYIDDLNAEIDLANNDLFNEMTTRPYSILSEFEDETLPLFSTKPVLQHGLQVGLSAAESDTPSTGYIGLAANNSSTPFLVLPPSSNTSGSAAAIRFPSPSPTVTPNGVPEITALSSFTDEEGNEYTTVDLGWTNTPTLESINLKDGEFGVTISPSTSLLNNVEYILPATNPTATQVLTVSSIVDNVITLSWSSAGSGSGTVTTVSIVTANGVSGSVATSTTTPAITLTLGNITPTSVNASGTITGTNISGTNTGDQTITLTSDVTGSGTGSFTTTIANDAVTYAKMQNSSAASILIGRGAGSGAGDLQEITLGTNISLTGTVLNVSGSGSPAGTTLSFQYNNGGIFAGTWDGTNGIYFDGVDLTATTGGNNWYLNGVIGFHSDAWTPGDLIEVGASGQLQSFSGIVGSGGTFTTVDGKTVTYDNRGLITNVV